MSQTLQKDLQTCGHIKTQCLVEIMDHRLQAQRQELTHIAMQYWTTLLQHSEQHADGHLSWVFFFSFYWLILIVDILL